MRIRNPLLFWSWALFAGYWAIGPFIPDPVIALGAAFGTMIAAAINAAKYGPDVVQVLFHGKRDDDPGGRGSHIALYGVFLISVGALYSGAYGTVWIVLGQPDGWSATIFSSFGRVLMGIGFVMMTRSSDMAREAGGSLSYWWALALGTVLLSLAYLAGTQSPSRFMPDAQEFYRRHGDDRPVCPPDRPIWGSQNGVYHDENSVYRAQVIPQRCFMTPEEARSKGFRPPN